MVLLSCACRKELLNCVLRGYRRTTCRLISTSEKKKEVNEACPPPDAIYKKIPDFSKPLENKHWVAFGHEKDKYEDMYTMHMIGFWMITVLLTGSFFLYFYRPDYRRFDWAKREAFIRLHEREQLGLEPVDKNYVDPSQVVLPPDEELSEEDIII